MNTQLCLNIVTVRSLYTKCIPHAVIYDLYLLEIATVL